MVEEAWYQQLRKQWKPSKVNLLLIAESAPDDGGDADNRRFFYSEPLSQSDNLFRSVVAALYDGGKLSKGDTKRPWLTRLRNDGVYLIDLASRPVNGLSPAARSAALRAGVQDCVQAARELNPAGIVVCHTPTYKLLAGPLRDAGLPLLHGEAIPFPLGNKRDEFIQKVREATGISADKLTDEPFLDNNRLNKQTSQPAPTLASSPSTSSEPRTVYTPAELARELGYTSELRPGKVVREHLRRKYPTHSKHQRWLLDVTQADDVRRNVPRKY